jgi:hypothetical protein
MQAVISTRAGGQLQPRSERGHLLAQTAERRVARAVPDLPAGSRRLSPLILVACRCVPAEPDWRRRATTGAQWPGGAWTQVIESGYEGYVAEDEASPYEAAFKQKGWTVEDDRWQRRISAGMEHSRTSATGAGWKRTQWQATQRAAWEALRQASRDG